MPSITELNLNTENILKTQLVNSLGLSKYAYLVKNLQTTDLIADGDNAVKFRKIYNSFYRVRRNDTWRGVYYGYFQEAKKIKGIEFKDLLEELQGRLMFKGINSLEPSLASKMLATINKDMPIWDNRVLVSLSLNKEWEKERSIGHAINIYESICKQYKEFESTGKCNECLSYLSG